MRDIDGMNLKLIKSERVLRMLERAGLIAEPPEHVRPYKKGKPLRWGLYGYVDTVEAVGTWFAHQGRHYRLKYVDGCFFPYLYERVGTKHET